MTKKGKKNYLACKELSLGIVGTFGFRLSAAEPNLKYFHINVPHNTLNINCTNGYSLPNERAARAVDKK